MCDNIPTKTILFFFGCSEVNSTWLITSELANSHARKVLLRKVLVLLVWYILIQVIYNFRLKLQQQWLQSSLLRFIVSRLRPLQQRKMSQLTVQSDHLVTTPFPLPVCTVRDSNRSLYLHVSNIFFLLSRNHFVQWYSPKWYVIFTAVKITARLGTYMSQEGADVASCYLVTLYSKVHKSI